MRCGVREFFGTPQRIFNLSSRKCDRGTTHRTSRTLSAGRNASLLPPRCSVQAPNPTQHPPERF